MTDGVAYWRRVLKPHAERGFTRGLIDDLEVTLFGPDDEEIHLARPSARWAQPRLPSLDGLDEDREATARGVRWLMKVGNERHEVSA